MSDDVAVHEQQRMPDIVQNDISAPTPVVNTIASADGTHYHHVEVSRGAQAHLGDIHHHHNVEVKVIGTVGTIAGTIDVAGRSISILADIRKRCKGSDVTFEILSSQLTSVKIALSRIRILIEQSLQDDQHYQLVIDLDTCMRACHPLLELLDDQISKLVYDEDQDTSFESKVEMILESKVTQHCLTMLGYQLAALNIIVTAFHASNPTQQKEVLDQKKARETFGRVKDDTASLYAICGSASFRTSRTKITTATSKLSMNFDFDSELLQHGAYKAAFRSLLRRTGRRHVTTGVSEHSSVATLKNTNSAEIDRKLKEDAKKLRKECTVLVAGKGSMVLMQKLEAIHHGGYTQEYVSLYRMSVYTALRNAVGAAASLEQSLDKDTQMNIEWLESLPAVLGEFNELEPQYRDHLSWCASRLFPKLADSEYLDFAQKYFLSNTNRIMSADYIPTETDVLHLSTKENRAARDFRFIMRRLSIHITEMPSGSERKKSIRMFEGVTAIMYTVDLACYDQLSIEEANQSQMVLELMEFDSMVNSRWFARSAIILLLCNFGEFKLRLARSPLGNYFPDFSGGNDANRAAEYLRWRFEKVSRVPLFGVYSYLGEFSAAADFQIIVRTLEDILTQHRVYRYFS